MSPSGGNIGIGFAIPSNMAETVMAQLVNGGEVHRGQLGVTVQGVTSDLAESLGLAEVEGALVSAVTDGQPGREGGPRARRRDRRRSTAKPVTDSNALRNRVASHDARLDA